MNTNKTTAADMRRICACAHSFVKDPAYLPVSYKAGETVYRGIPASFSPNVSKRFVDSNIVEYTVTAVNPDIGVKMTAECVEYLDFPVVEWTYWLENVSDKNTPIITDFHGMDGVLPGEDPVIVYNTGDTCDRELFTDRRWDLTADPYFTQHPDGGRGSDCALPYYRVLCKDFGYTISIGWPGQWISEFSLADGGFLMKARQQYARFYLKPGEKVRTARMTVMTFEGGEERGINLWRRFMIAHVIPKPNGALPDPFCAAGFGGEGVCFTLSSEKQQLSYIDKCKASEIGNNVYWIDAGWYTCQDKDTGVITWNYTGGLFSDPIRYPNGLASIGKRCHQYGMKFLLWFEPERVYLKHIFGEYPDRFVIRLKDESVLDHVRLTGVTRRLFDNMGLMDLSNPECVDWLITHIDGMIKEYGIDIYRQDFNFAPLNWWLQNDEEDRLGITENLYNQGYLRFWDELLLRNPGLLINSVASGGRRSDLESMRRSVSLHQTDYGHGIHPIDQCTSAFSHTWEVYSGTMAFSWDDAEGNYTNGAEGAVRDGVFDNFMAHNAFSPSFWYEHRACMAMPDGEYAGTEECAYFKKFQSIWERAVPYMLDSDFYVLKQSDRTNTCWHAIQFHNEEKNEGVFQAIRNTCAPEETFTAYLRGIDPKKTYFLQSPEFDRTATVSGAELIEKGFPVSLPKRTGEIWFYRAL